MTDKRKVEVVDEISVPHPDHEGLRTTATITCHGYFHLWSDGQCGVYAVVELDDGRVRMYEPDKIRFVDEWTIGSRTAKGVDFYGGANWQSDPDISF